jgi:hypothetical protein
MTDPATPPQALAADLDRRLATAVARTGSEIVAEPPRLRGDLHLTASSPARSSGSDRSGSRRAAASRDRR